MSGPLGLPGGDQILSFMVKGVAGGIGLASEGIHAHKERKRHEKELKEHGGEREHEHEVLHRENSSQSTRSLGSEGGPMSPNEKEDEIDMAEGIWQLDDAQDEVLGAEHEEPLTKELPLEEAEEHVRGLQNHFLNAHRHDGPLKPEGGRLQLPVILPQRRPKNRTRGFVRAYAPMLEECGITTDMWLNFLDTFEQASQASPWLNALNMAGMAGMMLPHGISLAVSVAVTMSVRIIMDMQSRQRINKFLVKINEEFFQPRGLFCLVMTWKPESQAIYETIDLNLNQTVDTAMTSYNSGMLNKFKQGAGTTFGDFFPEAAPLIFPTLDIVAASDHEEAKSFKEKMACRKNFVADYYDRRATAEFQGEHPDNLLSKSAGYTPKFTSRYADPNHPANSGNLLSLLTGGHFNPPPGTLGGGLASRGAYGRGMGVGMGRFGGFGGLGRGMGMGMYGGREAFVESRMAMMGGGYGYGGREMLAESRMAMMGGGFGRGFGGRGMGMGMMGPGYYDPSGRGMGMQYQQDPYMSPQNAQQQQFMQSQQLQHQQQLYYQQQQQMGYYNQAGGYGAGYGLRGLGFGGLSGDPTDPIFIKKMLKKNVLYLMVVNMPSEEELAAAEAELEKMRGYKQY